MSNAINWFELPSTNFSRAIDFYSKLLDVELQASKYGEADMAFFPAEDKGVGGCVIQQEGRKPSAEGSLVYLNGGDDLSAMLARVEPAGGQVVMPKTNIGENGFIAMFNDTEGNRVALHSMA